MHKHTFWDPWGRIFFLSSEPQRALPLPVDSLEKTLEASSAAAPVSKALGFLALASLIGCQAVFPEEKLEASAAVVLVSMAQGPLVFPSLRSCQE